MDLLPPVAEQEVPVAGFDLLHGDHCRGFADLVQELGGDPYALLRAVGLETYPPGVKPPLCYGDWARLLEHSATELGCADFGLRLARRQGGGTVFGPIRAVWQNARTFGEALEYFCTHIHVHSLAARVRLDPDPASRTTFASHEVLVERLPNKRQLMEYILLLGHLNAVETTGGRARVREVRFRHQPLSPLKTYYRYFGCEVRFDQQEDGVVYGDSDLACPIVNADAGSYARAVANLEAQFPSASPPLPALVRGLILQLLGAERCSNEVVAAKLDLHSRTLHRRLRAQRTSFQRIKDDVRRDVALYFLEHTDFDLAYVAHKLGYSEHSVFSRSCSRWFSMPPAQLRERRQRVAAGAG
jgi:AraC-like DNA-binding protein